MKKRCIALSMAVFMGFNFNLGISNAEMVDHTVYEIPLSSSIKFKKVDENYGYNVNKFNIIEADLNNPNNTLDVIFNTQGLDKTMSIKNTAENMDNVVAVSNADFFLLQTPTSSLGPLVKNHKVMASPFETPNKFASMVITNSNKVSFEYIKPSVILRNISQKKDYNVPTMNKVLSSAYSGITIRTSDYAYNTFGKSEKDSKRVEILVGDDYIVKEIRENQDYTRIPYGGFAIMSFNMDGTELKNQFNIGDKLDIQLDITMQRPDIKTIIGGGSLLLKNGQKTNITSKVSGKSQRTAVGITKDNKLVIITNDGRTATSAGLDEKDMQNFMYSMGIKDAMMFDGGGSTELFADGKVQNYIYRERKVINALVLKNEKHTGNVSKVNLVALDDIVYTGEEVELIASAEDENGSKVTKYNTGDFQLTTTGFKSDVKKRKIIPTTPGKGTVNATIKGVTAKVDMEVLSSRSADNKYKKISQEVKKFNIYSNMDDGDDLISKVVKSKIAGLSENTDNNLVIGNNDMYFTTVLKGRSKNINISTPNQVFDNTLVVSINNNTAISRDENQWKNLKSALASKSKNIIIAMQGGSSIYSFVEQNSFDKILEKSAKDKNIYVVYKSNVNDGYKRGNVSYISIIDLKNQNYTDLKNVKYLEMYEDENSNLVYNYKSVV